MRRILAEFRRVGPSQPDNVATEFDHGALHSQANPKERNTALASKADGFHLSLDTAFAEAARNQDTVEASQNALGAVSFDHLALNALDPHLRPVMDARVIERFVNRLVGIPV